MKEINSSPPFRYYIGAKFSFAILKSMVLSRFLKTSIGLLTSSCVFATPLQLQSRGTIASDEIVGFAQTVPSGTVGNVYLAYKPYLYVVNGCVPFPAVDAAGDTKSVACYRQIILSGSNTV